MDDMFAEWLANNLHNLTETSAELLESIDAANLDAVRCSTVCQINSPSELRIFKFIVKSIENLN